MGGSSNSKFWCLLLLVNIKMMIMLGFVSVYGNSELRVDYYASTCPTVFDVVKKEMECAVQSDPRNAAIMLRLHFHDCFVQGCDGSVLLDDTVTLQGEKKAATNIHSLKGFGVVDRIKNMLESECPGIVSCADLLTIAARDAVLLVGGPYWDVPLGRKDSITASFALANTNLPTPDESLFSIISKFLYQDLSLTDMVALLVFFGLRNCIILITSFFMGHNGPDQWAYSSWTGAHTIGMARCENFRSRIYGDFDEKNPISQSHLADLRSICPPINGGDNNVTAMDYVTPNLFDNSFYQLLLKGEGLLNSDQELYSSVFGIQTRDLVTKYAADPLAFFQQFSDSMVKMGNILNPEGGEVRRNCRFVNT